MKKSLIALAVASAMTVPMLAQADATLYGEVEYRLIDQDSFTSTDDEDNVVDNESTLNGEVDTIQIGVKGSVDNDIDGLETGFQIEWEFAGRDSVGQADGSLVEEDVSTESEVRKALVYMSGDWGRATFGQQNNPAEVAERDYGINGDEFSALADRTQGIVYSSPDMNGFQIEAGIVVDSGDEAEDDVDAYTVGLAYAANGLEVGLGYFSVDDSGAANSEDGDEVLGLGVTYAINDFEIIFGYQDVDPADNGEDWDTTLIGAAYSFGATTLSVQYAEKDVEGDAEEQELALIHAEYSLGDNAFVAVEYIDFNGEASFETGAGDQLTFAYGVAF